MVSGPLLIVAGPGTGKTRTLTRRIAHLVAAGHAAPEACLAITFTNRAAGELRQRLEAIVPGVGGRVAVATFHSLALSMLREHRLLCGLHRGFRVADDDQRAELITRVLDCSPRRARRLLSQISAARRASAAPTGDLAEAMAAYSEAMDAASLIDFDDLLVRAVDLLAGHDDVRRAYRDRYRWISIDEYQDIDELQYRLVKLLCPEDGNLCAIGDPDQAIYSFRGADVGFFLRFRGDFPSARTVALTRNYRSARSIVAASLQAVAPSSLVGERRLDAMTERAGSIEWVRTASDRAEAEFVVHTIEKLIGGTSYFSVDSGRVGPGDGPDGDPGGDDSDGCLGFGDFAVLYRSDAQSVSLCEALARSGIPFQKRAHGRLSDRPVVAALARTVAELAEAGAGGGQAVTSALGGIEDDDTVVALVRAASAQLSRSGLSPGDDVAAVDGDADRAGSLPPELAAEPSTFNLLDTLEHVVELLVPLARAAGRDVERFLSDLACGTDSDLWDPRADRVSLLTLHAAKGLEFPVVFVVGCEDGILPLRWGGAAERASDTARDLSEASATASADASPGETDDIAEERRLFFVGMTRAERLLYLTRAGKRRWRGQLRELPISPFIADIDP
ncbi:MAG: ATP-dependent helicase, partial [Myxococcota bacterium]